MAPSFRCFPLLRPSSLLCSRLRCIRPPLARAMSGPIVESSIIHEAIEEERHPNYNPNSYFPTRLGQVLNDRYQIITKLGWGLGSTVWLAEDLWQSRSGGPSQPVNSATPSASRCEEEPESPRFVAIKIGTSINGSIAAAEHELKISQHIATANPSHPGARYIRNPINHFQVDGAYGTHICLVYRPMRETLCCFRKRFKKQRLPPQFLKLYIAVLLQGLNYLHSECHFIHTGKS